MKEKNYNLELIRLVSFILVIVIHVTNYFCRAYGEITQGEYVFSLALDTAARVSVPCFFMISGALLLGRQEPLRKHVRRLARFLIVLAVWSAVYYLWNRFYMGTPYELRDILTEPTEAHLWYLYAMIPIYLTLPFFQVLCRGMSMKLEKAFLAVTTAAVVLNYLLRLAGQELYYDIPLVGDRIYAYYLYVGYYLYKYRRHTPLGQRPALVLCLLSTAATFGITLGVTVEQGEHYEGALTYESIFVIVAAVTFFLFMLRLGNAHIRFGERAKKVISLFCGCSFGIYLIHILFLDNYKKYMEAADLTAWAAVPVLTAGITLVSFVCVWVIRRFKIGRKIT
ncbi:MAG TPA: acyltransferase family protein [Candidatus Mediterraneibacter caccavium]|uniref:Acyltransferase family protein n=1 Tax=Candidatus Mediterraneibacter caccavium TaxID=2838661 RepID=A0A9D1VZ66_9FIRM|nr:acyltransferase family protein [Candidatus Mediterraneibacter caccavium]